MKTEAKVNLLVALVLLLIVAAAVLTLVVLDAHADSQESPVWRIEWRGQSRYLKTDDGWHVFGRNATWVPIPGTPDDPMGGVK